MTINKVPMKMRPVLKLKLGPASTSAPAPAAVPATVKAVVTVAEVVVPTPPELNEVEIAGRARRAERWKAMNDEKATATKWAAEKEARIARRIAAYEAGKIVLQQRAIKMQETLAARFPACFRTSWPKLPLMIGVDRAVITVAPDLNADDVRWGIKVYVREPAYLQMMIAGAVRVDLDGHPAGVVIENEADWTAMRAARRS
jgi:hypothetical protein